MAILSLSGCVSSPSFQEAKLLLEDVAQLDGLGASLDFAVESFLEPDWIEHLQKKRIELGGLARTHPSHLPLIHHSLYGYLTLDQLINYLSSQYGYEDPRDDSDYKKLEEEFTLCGAGELWRTLQTRAESSGNRYVYMDFSVDSRNSFDSPPPALVTGIQAPQPGQFRVVFELYAAKLPRTCQNFEWLCSGKNGSGESVPCYQGSPMHRLVKGGFMQFGDLVDGSGAHSACCIASERTVNGAKVFEDENLTIPHSGFGCLAMANHGPHTNGSQFVIELTNIPAFNGRFVAFGRVVAGYAVLQYLNSLSASSKLNQRPVNPITIAACGPFTMTAMPAGLEQWLRSRAEKQELARELKLEEEKDLAKRLHSASLPPPLKSATLLILGLQGSGKTTIVNHFLEQAHFPTNPTTGFELKRLDYGEFDLKLYGLGGAENLRGYWRNYYDAAHGVIFVVDSGMKQDDKGWDNVREAFLEAISHSYIKGKPVLIYANKQDAAEALSATEILYKLGIQGDATLIAPECVHLQKCIALSKGNDDRQDKMILKGLEWLCSAISKRYVELSDRVAADVKAQKAKAKAEMEAAREKVARAKAEREREEAEKRNAAAAAAQEEKTAA